MRGGKNDVSRHALTEEHRKRVTSAKLNTAAHSVLHYLAARDSAEMDKVSVLLGFLTTEVLDQDLASGVVPHFTKSLARYLSIFFN